jgi:co-chaperonin GroES (HSP10)
MIKPCGHRLVVKPFKLSEVDKVYERAMNAGLEIVRNNQKREDQSVDKGTVLAIGPTAWQTESLGGQPWCKVGDTILFAKFSPKWVEDPDTKDQLGILNDEDVVAVLEEKKDE